MYYYWWLIAVFLYLGILTLYALLMAVMRDGEPKSNSSDSVFFAIASVVTLSMVPLMKENLYG